MSSNHANNLINLTENAGKHIAELILEEPNSKNVFFRIQVEGGGCSGFQYKFSFDTKVLNDDIILEKSGAKIVIDSVSLGFLQSEGKGGAVIDFVEELGASYFAIKNPLATANCGCGNSFSV
jgi:iron-sulfur cluster assembly accessory protein